VGVLSQMTYLHSAVDAKTAKACLFPQVRLVLVRRRGRENMKYFVSRIIYANQLAGVPVMEFPLRLVHQVTNAQGARKPVETACEAH
jgi:hypothetical protein